LKSLAENTDIARKKAASEKRKASTRFTPLPEKAIHMMKKHVKILVLLTAFLWPAATLWAQLSAEIKAHSDGPYIFDEEGQWVARWVHEGQVGEDTLQPGRALKLPEGVSLSFDSRYLDLETDYQLSPQTSFKDVARLAVISDVHGQYFTMLSLLQANGVVDDQADWTFGDGHLVIVGDVFDRGDKVTDIFWLIYKLEKQAEKSGGKVHFLLGNHEVMVLQNDLRYVNRIYRFTMGAIRRSYNALYGPDTYLGRWLRSKPVAITINNIAFSHAGFSEPVLKLGLSFQELNTLFQDQIIDQSEEIVMNDPILSLLYTENGLIWYRGYFSDGFTREDAHRNLRRLKAKHVVVGHTSHPQIMSLYRRRVIGVDSSIKLGGKNGELLLIDHGHFYRAGHDGRRIKLK
jgi:hypothetical protein